MKRLFASFSHVAVFVAAYHWSHSTSGFLITAMGLSLLLDRYALRLISWPTIPWKKECLLRAGPFFGGATLFYFMRPGIVPLWEAAYRGMMVCLVAFLVEQLLSLMPRQRWRLCTFAIVVLILLIPFVAALHPLHTVPKRTPAALNLHFEDVRFSTADGVELAAWLIPHPYPRGNLIFCHGHGRNRGHVAALLPTFHALGLNVLAFDFRGHGDSGGHTSTFGFLEVEDLLAAEAYLRGRCPDQPLLLAGISLGAAVSLQALPRLPDVRGVWSEGAFARFGNAVDYKFSALPNFLRAPLIGSYCVLGWLECRLWVPSVNPLDCLDGLTPPIFFCHGERDQLVPLREGQMLYTRYGGTKRYWWVAGASHYNVRQRHRKEYLDRLRSFLEDCLSCRLASTRSGAHPAPGNGSLPVKPLPFHVKASP
ncbi:MAG TPA: alpha/beta hydrolase [Gemmataceae bacterium]|nr:alpha/beta hydrolase [Gemmataceae bacterium]